MAVALRVWREAELMPQSYFAPYANATLIFSIPDPTGAATIDPDTGNEKRAPRFITITASLKQSKYITGTKYENTPGAKTLEVKIGGYIVLPFPYIPDEVKALMVADAVVSGRPGKFRLEKVLRSPYGVEAVLGDKIEGVFYE